MLNLSQWNASSVNKSDTEVIFESEDYNMAVASGQKTSFGFRYTGGEFDDISSLVLVQGKTVAAGEASVSFKETSSWKGHKIYEGTITNSGKTSLKDWKLSFEADGLIQNIWNANVTESKEEKFYLENCDYNAVIEAGQSVKFGFEITFSTEDFSGIHNACIYANNQSGKVEETPSAKPTITPVITPCYSQMPTPVVSKSPEVTATPETTENPDTQDITEDDIEFVQVDNRDWNMDMVHANDDEVEKAKKNTDKKIKVTMLDSGINFSEEVNVVQRKNFVEGQDEMNYLFEDCSGHGTAIAEVLASNPQASVEQDANVDYDDEYGKILDENNKTTVDRAVEGIE